MRTRSRPAQTSSDAQALASLPAPPRQHRSPLAGAHPHQEAMGPFATTVVGLKRPFHCGPPSSLEEVRGRGRAPAPRIPERNWKLSPIRPGPSRNGRFGGVSQFGGEGGIRTHGPVARSTVFETVPFNHSSTSPRGHRSLAERVGFEPTVEFPLHTLSKRAP